MPRYAFTSPPATTLANQTVRRRGELRWYLRSIVALCVAIASFGCTKAPPAESVILIVIDTLRADHLSTYGYERETSPCIDRYSQHGAVFENAFSSSSWTLPAFGTILTGEIPSRHRAGTLKPRVEGEARAKEFFQLDPNLPTLSSRLSEAGWQTAAIMNNAFLSPNFGLDRGFDRYDFDPANQHRLRNAEEAVDLALAWLDQHQTQPFFLLLHLFDPHIGYSAPAPFFDSFASQERNEDLQRLEDIRDIRRALPSGTVDMDYLVDRYDEEIRFVDDQIGRFLDQLTERELWSRSLVLLTSDHGEEFLDHGGFEHGHSMYDELLRVPLILWVPHGKSGRNTVPVSLVDLEPTILDAMGLPDSTPGPGQPLLSLRGDERRTLVAERTLYGPDRSAAIRWPHKLMTRGGGRPLQLFDLEQDPDERENARKQHPALVRELSVTLEAAASQNSPDSEVAAPDQETLDSLRSLGYIQ